MLSNIRIKANQTGLVLKNGRVTRVLSEGKHWIFLGESLQVYDMTFPFLAGKELAIYLENNELASRLEVIEVKDNEAVFVYINGNFSEVLTAGNHSFWKGVMEYKFVKADTSSVYIDESIPKVLLDQVKVRPMVRKFTVASDEAGLLFVDGKFVRQLASGTYQFWQNSTTIEIKSADLRMQSMEIAGQELLTKDKAALRINFFVRFKISNVVMALLGNKDWEKQLYLLMQLALREIVGGLALDELLSRRESMGREILQIVSGKATQMGISVTDTGVRDFILPGDMKDIMNQVLVAEKKAQANTITRREETASTRSLLNTAKLMEDNAMLFKLKEMEYVEKIAEKINTISLSGSGQIVDQLKQIFVK